jgi:glycosyltransferase involved in cell wall biosynthesis
MNISFFCPAFNEEENLEKAVHSILPVLKDVAADFEIIVIDNCSTDKTPQIAEQLAKEIPQLKVIHNEMNKGYGGALITGFKAAQKDIVAYTDSDNQYDFNEFKKLSSYLDRYDAVIGYRLKRHDSIYRLVQSAIFNMIVTLLFGVKFRDINCSFKIYRKEVLESMDISSKSAFIDAEMLIKALNNGYRIVEVPVAHFKRMAGKASGAKPGMIFLTIQEMVSFWLNRLFKRKSGRKM